MKKRAGMTLLAVLLVFLTAGCALVAPVDAVDPASTETVLVEIPQGSGLGTVAELLKGRGLIRSELGFKSQAKAMKAEADLKAGTYELSKAMSAEEIIDKLVAGAVYVERVKVVIPEGYELKQIVQRLEEAGLIEPEAFQEAMETGGYDYRIVSELPEGPGRMEGFLFPATYQIPKGASEQEIVTMLLGAFDRQFKSEWYDRAKELDMTVLEVVTLASIVEREAKLDSERPLIAGVFHNRLKIGKQLESCATVQYALGERKTRLYFKDLEVKSPYNTYKHTGLPPGPIASPGTRSIEAVLYPEASDYLFFRTSAKGDGSHDFSKTFQEHQISGDGSITP